jgi:putative endonuclease
MAFTVYVLRNPAGRLYIGQTADLKRRLAEHERGFGGWTRQRGPWELILEETYANRSEAMRRERVLKSGQGREWLHTYLSAPTGGAGPPQAD